MDFTLSTYCTLLETLKAAGYAFQPYAEYLADPAEKVVILRHDVDKRPGNSLVTAQIEHELGIRGTYYFRILPCSFNPEIIKEIYSLGHEIGYHYEDINLVPGTRHPIPSTRYPAPDTRHPIRELVTKAILSFETNLSIFRELTPVTTICMHGSPLSRYDNRLLWEYYAYSDYGIIGEPYFDTDFSKVLYLTDTGRTWNNKKISIRDKPTPHTLHQTPNADFHSSFDIIKAAKRETLSSQIMFTIHPQRWTSNIISWIQEFVSQNIKNIVKRLLVSRNR